MIADWESIAAHTAFVKADAHVPVYDVFVKLSVDGAKTAVPQRHYLLSDKGLPDIAEPVSHRSNLCQLLMRSTRL